MAMRILFASEADRRHLTYLWDSRGLDGPCRKPMCDGAVKYLVIEETMGIPYRRIEHGWCVEHVPKPVESFFHELGAASVRTWRKL